MFAALTAPFSVNALGRYLGLRCLWEPVTICDRFKVANCDLKPSNSSNVNRNMKSAGNFLLLRLTAWLKTLVVTPYILANSISKTTFCPRIVRITGSRACELYLASFSVIGHPFPLRWVFHPGA